MCYKKRRKNRGHYTKVPERNFYLRKKNMQTILKNISRLDLGSRISPNARSLIISPFFFFFFFFSCTLVLAAEGWTGLTLSLTPGRREIPLRFGYSVTSCRNAGGQKSVRDPHTWAQNQVKWGVICDVIVQELPANSFIPL